MTCCVGNAVNSSCTDEHNIAMIKVALVCVFVWKCNNPFARKACFGIGISARVPERIPEGINTVKISTGKRILENVIITKIVPEHIIKPRYSTKYRVMG